MKKDISLISFSRTGGLLAGRIRDDLKGKGFEAEAFALARYSAETGLPAAEPDLKNWCREHWSTDQLIVFVGASGIAVRTIAPCVKSKVTDPAVLVIDETGHFVISLLSGHLGGANLWTEMIAEQIGAVPVITTATDSHGLFAVDVWAKKNGLVIDSMKQAKEISAAVLRGEKVWLFCPEGETVGPIPEELTQTGGIPDLPAEIEDVPMLILVDYHGAGTGWYDKWPAERTLRLIPRCITLGIGCRREQAAEIIQDRTELAVRTAGVDPRSIERIVSIDLKKNEEGILKTAEKLHVPFDTFTAEELKQAEGDFTASSFVAGVTGVDNVCERSAVLGSENGKMILKKQAGNGVTAAAAMRQWRIEF